MKKCLIALGNELQMDDGVGVVAARELQLTGLSGYDIYILENELFQIADIIPKYQHIVIVDALPPGEYPGALIALSLEDYLSQEDQPYSLHDFDLFWQIQAGINNGFTGKVELFGIVTFQIRPNYGLSTELTTNFHGIIEKLRSYLQ